MPKILREKRLIHTRAVMFEGPPVYETPAEYLHAIREELEDLAAAPFHSLQYERLMVDSLVGEVLNIVSEVGISAEMRDDFLAIAALRTRFANRHA